MNDGNKRRCNEARAVILVSISCLVVNADLVLDNERLLIA